MKKTLCILLVTVFLFGVACAGEMSLDMWQHEGGWMSFTLGLMQEDLAEVWDEGAKVFGESMGIPGLTGDMLQQMMMQGYSMSSFVDEVQVEGNRITGQKDGTELFRHEYAFAETLEEEDVMGGKRVHVFRTEENAGEYTYLLMTEPLRTEGDDGAGYVTFNLFHAKDDYRALFIAGKGKTLTVPCAMMEKDTDRAGIKLAIEKIYSQPVVIGQ